MYLEWRFLGDFRYIDLFEIEKIGDFRNLFGQIGLQIFEFQIKNVRFRKFRFEIYFPLLVVFKIIAKSFN